MAYDQNGNYYFDPNSDYDDAELVREEQRRQQAKNYVKNQVEFGKKQQEGNQIIIDACKEAGISPEEFNQFMQNKDAFQAQVRSVAHKAAQAKGRKPKHKESASDDFMQTSKPASAMGLGRRYDDGKTFHEKWKKGENRSGSDREVLDMLTDMIGDDPMFKTSYDLNKK